MKIIYENKNLLVVDKSSGVVVFPGEGQEKESLIKKVLKKFPELKKVGNPPRFGLIHRIDKSTSGIILIAKNEKALNFFQQQFKNRTVFKKYTALVMGNTKKSDTIKTLIGRSPNERTKQKVFLPLGPKSKGKREAVTKYNCSKKFKNYSLVEAFPKTGRKHQIRVHFSYINHPIAGDKKYGFRGQENPDGLNRLFLHASALKIKLTDGTVKEFKSELTSELKHVLKNLK